MNNLFRYQPDETSGAEPAPHIKEAIENGEWQRAGGECICLVCGKPYSTHPNVPGAEWLNKLCDGMLVKL